MKTDLYKYEDTHNYLKYLVKAEKSHIKGFQSRLAEAAKCSKPHMSLVLRGQVSLTPDQAFGIGDYLGFTTEEQQYFQLLLAKDRASTKRFKDHLAGEIKKLATRAKKLASKTKAQLQENHQTADFFQYYADWRYSAVHVASSISTLQSVEALCKYFHFERPQLLQIVSYLETLGLVTKTGDRIEITNSNIHVDKDSPYYPIFSQQWSDKLLETQKDRNPNDFNYTSCFSCSQQDYELIFEELNNFFSKFQKQVVTSPEERLAVLKLNLSEL